jgi:hypothetical protein
VRERALGDYADGDQSSIMALEDLENDQRQATYTIILEAIVSVILSGLLVATVLSQRACSV